MYLVFYCMSFDILKVISCVFSLRATSLLDYVIGMKRFTIAFTANDKRGVRVYVFLKKQNSTQR